MGSPKVSITTRDRKITGKLQRKRYFPLRYDFSLAQVCDFASPAFQFATIRYVHSRHYQSFYLK